MKTSSNPPLSYADRAKKAPGVKGPSASASKPPPPPSSRAVDGPSISSRSSAVETYLNGKPLSLPSSDDFPPPSSASVLASPPPAARPSQPHLAATDDKPTHLQSDHALSSESAPADLAPSIASASSSKGPPVNVWNQRMAQARAQARPLQSISQNTVTNTTSSSSTRNATNGSSALSTPRPSSNTSVSPSTRHQNVAPSPTGHGSTSGTSSKKEDSPPIQAPRAPAAVVVPPPPLAADTESWPEVGKAAVPVPKASQPPSGRQLDEKEKEKSEQAGKSDETLTANKKSERTRWVTIPREEWQASSEPRRPHRSQPHSRNHSQYSGHRQGPGRGTSRSGAGSANASQGPSKAGSGRTSKASSVQSSPRRSTRGRQLPSSDLPAPVASVASSSLSTDAPPCLSRTNSPHVFAETTFAAPVPYVSIDPSVYRHDASPAHPPNGPTFYMHPPPPAMPPSMQPSPSHPHTPYSPTSASPFHPLFTVHPNGFMPTPHGAPPLMQGYPGSPPYPMYGPYGYPYGQPYPYWNGVTQEPDRSPHHGPFPPYAPAPVSTVIPPTAQEPPPEPDAPKEPAAEGIQQHLIIPRPLPPQESDAVAGGNVIRGRTSRDVVFGSFGYPEGSMSPPPVETGVVGQDEPAENQRPVLQFTVGVAPGEAGPSHLRSRTRSNQRLRDAVGRSEGGEVEQTTVIDLTDPETKWEFGTAMHDEGTVGTNEVIVEPVICANVTDPGPVVPLSGDVLGNNALSSQSRPKQQQQPSPPPTPPSGLQLQMQASQPIPPQLPSGSSTDEWEVKDYGYGFGREGAMMQGASAAMPMPREDRKLQRDPAFVVRPRRGSYSGFQPAGYDGPSTHGRGGYTSDRGGFVGRRARGGYGRGLGGRGFGRGGARLQQAQQALPFTVTPPSQSFRPLPPPTPPLHADIGLFIPAHQPMPYVPPQGFEQYYPPFTPTAPSAPSGGVTSGTPFTSGAPMPRPVSQLTFPLDPTRFHLLGQLEYYLSSQNMAQDLFLRKRMDTRGWIPISLLASFNRVKQLTLDERLVKDVLGLSLVVEVQEDYVRMGGGEWERFVLPDAPLSTVERPVGEKEREAEVEVEEEDEDEDEVEFVMGKEADQPWVAS